MRNCCVISTAVFLLTLSRSLGASSSSSKRCTMSYDYVTEFRRCKSRGRRLRANLSASSMQTPLYVLLFHSWLKCDEYPQSSVQLKLLSAEHPFTLVLLRKGSRSRGKPFDQVVELWRRYTKSWAKWYPADLANSKAQSLVHALASEYTIQE